jgi:hypothetical protein
MFASQARRAQNGLAGAAERIVELRLIWAPGVNPINDRLELCRREKWRAIGWHLFEPLCRTLEDLHKQRCLGVSRRDNWSNTYIGYGGLRVDKGGITHIVPEGAVRRLIDDVTQFGISGL